MGFVFESKKSIIEILNGTKKDISDNIDLLAKAYTEKTGRKVCKTCPSDVQYMILTLKNEYNMTQFKFKRHAAMYKDKKRDKKTISNATMTDKRAIEFLKTNPERIKLFSEYPSNWEELLKGNKETAKEKKTRLAAEAEAAEVEKARLAAEADQGGETEAEKEARVLAEEGEALAVERKALAEKLMKQSLSDLRKTYPEIKATSIKDFVDKVLEK